MEPELMADGRLRIGSTLLDAAATSELIQRLAQIRAQMRPPIDTGWTALETIRYVQQPQFRAARTAAGLLLAFRHDGFGWCCFELTLDGAAHLRDFIAKRTAGITGTGLDDIGGTSH